MGPVYRWVEPVHRWVEPVHRWVGPVHRWVEPVHVLNLNHVCLQNNLLDKSSNIADPMASAAGIPCAVDPLLFAAMKPHVGKGSG